MISEKLHKELKSSFAKLGGRVLGASNKKLEVKGVSSPIKLKFKEKTYIVQPLVIKDLNDPVNIGRNFMKRCQIGLKFGHQNDVMTSEEGRVEMIKTIKEPKETGQERGRKGKRGSGARARSQRALPKPVVASEATLVPPNSLRFVKVNRLKGEQVVEPLWDETMQAPPAAYKDTDQVAVLNLAPDFRWIAAGEEIAEAYDCQVETIEAINEIKEEDQPAEEQMERTPVQEEQFQQLLKDLKIDKNAVLMANPAIRQRLIEMLEKYQDVFSSPGKNIGKTHLVEFVIRTVPGAQPVKHRVRPLNPIMRESLRKQIQEWKEEGIIEETSSPWAAAMVPCAKKDGGIRWAVDYRPLNKVTIVDAYPLPSIEENLQKLAGSCIFSTLDATSAYNTIPVEKKSRP
ncbi:MAG: reverse transcriptase family protein, partial [Arenicellales bacterium]|nr:reverse transcriptase family protein [Arenicellales bacterium]